MQKIKTKLKEVQKKDLLKEKLAKRHFVSKLKGTQHKSV